MDKGVFLFDKGVIIELYNRNLLTEKEKNKCMEILYKKYSISKGRGKNHEEQA